MEDEFPPRLIPEPPGAARRRVLRGFGTGLGAVFCLLAVRAWRNDASIPPFALLGASSWIVAWFRPEAFGTVYRLWMPVVAVLARLNRWLVCGALYYLVVTPYALLLRLLGKRPLELERDDRASYWTQRPPSDPVESSRRSF